MGSIYSYQGVTTYQPPTVVGGYTVQTPSAQYGAALYDVRTGQKMWTAEISSSGPAGDSYSNLARSAGENAITKLRADGLI